MLHIELLDRIWYGSSVRQWLVAAAVLGAVYVALSVLRRVLLKRLGTLTSRTNTRFDDLAVETVRRTRPYFILLLAVQAATRVAPVSGSAARVLNAVSVIIVLLQAGVWGNGLIGFAADHYARQRGDAEPGTSATIRAVGYALRFVLWALLLVTALQNFGIDVTALVTGLGVGGIAIALAVQNILGDLFAALAIVLDKPFIVGDFIVVDTVMGTVEHVGLKTTRLRSLGGEQIIISNNDLLKSRIRNYKRMQQRRVVFNIDVTYATPPDAVARIPGMIREVIGLQPLTQFERSHFLTFSDSALRFETVYWVLDADYNKYADIQHAINVELLRLFAAERIDFAFPSRTVYLSGGAAQDGTPAAPRLPDLPASTPTARSRSKP